MNKAFREYEWETVRTKNHSYTINKNKTIIVDLLAKPYKLMSGKDILSWAHSTGK